VANRNTCFAIADQVVVFEDAMLDTPAQKETDATVVF